jgi:serine/threonine protein kinase
MSDQPMVLEPGMLFAHGRYRLDHELGRGGTSQVWKGIEVHSEVPVAIKVLCRKDRTFILRFTRESRYFGPLSHDNIVRLMASGFDEHGVPFIVTELIVGMTLRRFYERKRFDVVQMAHIGSQGADAIACMHENGIAHRDNKPDNFMIGTEGKKKGVLALIDLGIAKFVNPKTHHIDTDGMPDVGTLQYMSPEQVRTPHDVDYHTDIWSFGATLYECLTGQYIFPCGIDATSAQLIHAIAYDEITHVQHFVPDAPEELSSIIMRCLRKDPKRRPHPLEIAEILAPLVRASLPPEHWAAERKEKLRIQARRIKAFTDIDEEALTLNRNAGREVPVQAKAAEDLESSGITSSRPAMLPPLVAIGADCQRTTLPTPEVNGPHRNTLPFLPVATRTHERRRGATNMKDDGEVGPSGTIRMESGGGLVARAIAQARLQAEQARAMEPPKPPRQRIEPPRAPERAAPRGTPTTSTMQSRLPLRSGPARAEVTRIVIQAVGIGAAISLVFAVVAIGIAEVRHKRLPPAAASSAPIAAPTSALPVAPVVVNEPAPSPSAVAVAPAPVALSATAAVTTGTMPTPSSGASAAAAALRSPIAPRRVPKSTPTTTRFEPLVGDDNLPFRRGAF